MSTSGKDKTPASTNNVEAYSKETLRKEIRRFITTNAQLINDKINIEAVKTKLEADKARLINEKNIFAAKKKNCRPN